MASAIPLQIAGALIYTSNVVENSTRPPEPFEITCDYLGLPSNCNARILPSQINAIVSELMNLAGCFDPDGKWDCTRTNNLCANFTQYRTDLTDTDGTVNLLNDIQYLLCTRQDQDATETSRFLYCDDDGNIRTTPLGGGACDQQVAAICASDACRTALAACLISGETDNGLEISDEDNLLYARSHGIVATTTWTASDRNLHDNNPNDIFGTTDITIPNSSDAPIICMIEIRLAVELIGRTPGATAQISASMFVGPNGTGGVRMDTVVGFPNTAGFGGNRDITVAYPPIRPFIIPPGGAQAHVGFQGGAVPNNGFHIRDIQGRLSAWGYYAKVMDVDVNGAGAPSLVTL